MIGSIYIRVDASAAIGLGHLMRCIALCEILQPHFEITFFLKEVPEELKLQISTCGAKVCQIKNEAEFISALTVSKIVVLDGYQFTTEFQKLIMATGATLVCIDDMTGTYYVADAVINYGPCVEATDIPHSETTKLYLGLSYVLLRNTFRKQAERGTLLRSNVVHKTAFVCFGGSDSLNLTSKTIRLLVSNGIDHVNAVVGAEFHQDLSWLSAAKYPNVQLYKSIDSQTMLSLMVASNFAIAPASSVLLELFSVGIPVITGYWAQNQEKGAKDFGDLGMAFYCGSFLENYESRLKNILTLLDGENKTLEEMCAKQKKLITNAEKNYITIFKQLHESVLQ